MSEADTQYQYILKHPDDKMKVIDFFTTEARNFVHIKSIIDSCKTNQDFENRLTDLIRMGRFVRDDKLPLLKKNYNFFQVSKKSMVDRLIAILKQKNKCKKEEAK